MNKLLTTALMVVGMASMSTAQQTKEYNFRNIKINPTDKGSLFTIPVEIEGKTTNFLLDSGSPRGLIYDVRIPRALKRELKPLEGQLGGAGGQSKAWMTTIHKTTIGGLIGYGKQETALVTQITNLGKYTIGGKPAHISGIVGAPVMSKMRAIFDYQNSRLLIPTGNPPRGLYKNNFVKQGGHAVPVSITKNGVPYIAVKVKGKVYGFMIDTGANSNFILPSVADDLGLKLLDKQTTVTGLGDKSSKVKAVVMEKPLLANKIQIPQLQTFVMELGDKVKPPANMKPGGIIGNKIFQSLKAQLDFDSSSLLIPAQK